MNNDECVKYCLPNSQHKDKDDLFICPFDPVHRVAGKRFVRHILKCMKNHPNIDMEICPFNSRHIMPKKDMKEHLPNCPDKDYMENEIVQPPVENLCDHNFANDEDWSNDLFDELDRIEEEPAETNIRKRRQEIIRKKEAMKNNRSRDAKEGLRRPRMNPEEYAYQRKLSGTPTTVSKNFKIRNSVGRGFSLYGNTQGVDIVNGKVRPLIAANFTMSSGKPLGRSRGTQPKNISQIIVKRMNN